MQAVNGGWSWAGSSGGLRGVPTRERRIFTRGAYEGDDLCDLRVGQIYIHVGLPIAARKFLYAPEVDVRATSRLVRGAGPRTVSLPARGKGNIRQTSHT